MRSGVFELHTFSTPLNVVNDHSLRSSIAVNAAVHLGIQPLASVIHTEIVKAMRLVSMKLDYANVPPIHFSLLSLLSPVVQVLSCLLYL